MEGNLGKRAAALAVGLSLAVSACGSGAESIPDEVLPTTLVPSVDTSVPRVTAGSDVDIVLDLWTWTPVRGPAERVGPPALISGDNVLYSDDPLIVERIPTREVLLEHRSESEDAEWIIQDTVMIASRVVVSETTVSYPLEYRVTAFDLESGQDVVLAETDPILPDRRAIPSLAMSGSQVFWTETLPSGSVCVLSVDLEEADNPHIVVCSDPGGDSGIVGIQVSGGALSYVHSTYNAVRDSSCFEFVILELGSDDAGTVLASEPCAAFQGAGTGSVAAWSEVPSVTGVDYLDLPLHGVVRGDHLALGSGVGGSVKACEDHLYWRWVASDGSSSQIRTWEPGRPIRIIFEEDRPDWTIAGDIGCTDSHITVVRTFNGEGKTRGEILTARLP